MRSTGEAACIGNNFYEALVKASIAVGLKVPSPNSRGKILVTAGPRVRKELKPIVNELLRLGYKIYCTAGTASYFKIKGMDIEVLYKVSERKEPNILSYINNRKVDLVVNIPEPKSMEEYERVMKDEFIIRRKAVEMGIPVITVPKVLEELIKGLSNVKDFTIKSLQEYHAG
jgi:carbamoyl-phosphate synthase large subunit